MSTSPLYSLFHFKSTTPQHCLPMIHLPQIILPIILSSNGHLYSKIPRVHTCFIRYLRQSNIPIILIDLYIPHQILLSLRRSTLWLFLKDPLVKIIHNSVFKWPHFALIRAFILSLGSLKLWLYGQGLRIIALIFSSWWDVAYKFRSVYCSSLG